MKLKNLMVLATTALAVSLATPAAAVPVLDQSNGPPTNATGFVAVVTGGSSLERAQTFTVGLTGQLTSVNVYLSRAPDATGSATSNVTDPLLFDIRTTAAGAPTDANAGANILGFVSVAAAGIPVGAGPSGFVSIDLTALSISVTTGDVLAIALRTASTEVGAYRWGSTTTNTYANGASYSRINTGATAWGAVSNTFIDMLFQTYVDADTGPPTLPS